MKRLQVWWWERGEDWYTVWESGFKRGHWRYALTTLACSWRLHRIVFSHEAVPASYEPPEPPEPGWCCDWCGELYDGPRFAWARYRWWYVKALLTRSFHREAA